MGTLDFCLAKWSTQRTLRWPGRGDLERAAMTESHQEVSGGERREMDSLKVRSLW